MVCIWVNSIKIFLLNFIQNDSLGEEFLKIDAFYNLSNSAYQLFRHSWLLFAVTVLVFNFHALLQSRNGKGCPEVVFFPIHRDMLKSSEMWCPSKKSENPWKLLRKHFRKFSNLIFSKKVSFLLFARVKNEFFIEIKSNPPCFSWWCWSSSRGQVVFYAHMKWCAKTII